MAETHKLGHISKNCKVLPLFGKQSWVIFQKIVKYYPCMILKNRGSILIKSLL